MTVENTGDEGLTAQQIWDSEIAATSGTLEPVVKTEPVEPVVKTEPVAPTPPATPTPPANEDPFAGLHPAVRARLEAVDGLANRLRNAEGHIGGLSSANKRLETELEAAKAAAKTVQSAPTATQVATTAVGSEKWNQLKTEFPEWAEAVEERLGAQGAQPDIEALRKQIREELTAEFTGALSATRTENDAKTESRLVNMFHRGWTDTVKTPEFTAWMKSQPLDSPLHSLAASPVAEDAIDLLNTFKAHKDAQAAAGDPPPPAVDPAKVAEQRRKRLQEASSVARGSANLAPTKSVADMSDQEYWNHLAAQKAREKEQQQRR